MPSQLERPRLRDLFCGEGGAGMGYYLAGFSVYGVDNDPNRLALYPFPSHCGDVLEVMATMNAGGAVDFTHPSGHVEWLTGDDFDADHGSPTCTGYSRGTAAIPDRLDRYDRLIAVTRALLLEGGKPYVIENVQDASSELIDPVLLCARMFGLRAVDTDGTPLMLDRHRVFESNVPLATPAHPTHSQTPLPGTPTCACGKVHAQVAGVYSGARRDKYEARHVRKGAYVPPSLAVLRALIGAPWMSETGCFLSIPPIYSEHIGRQLIEHINQGAS